MNKRVKASSLSIDKDTGAGLLAGVPALQIHGSVHGRAMLHNVHDL